MWRGKDRENWPEGVCILLPPSSLFVCVCVRACLDLHSSCACMCPSACLAVCVSPHVGPDLGVPVRLRLFVGVILGLALRWWGRPDS